jgi:hypothetical protein
VADYFFETLGRRNVQVVEVSRIENLRVRSRFRAGGDARVMFHGCRSQSNESQILANGFQVSKCVSGGANFGTWFAYNAGYSDGGFTYVDCHGMKHLVLCIVSEKEVARDDKACMRVVAQDCAYPVWLLKYIDLNDVCDGSCMYQCDRGSYAAYSDYLDDFDDDDYDVHEDIDLLWKTFRESRRATRALRQNKRQMHCHAKRTRLGCMLSEAQTRRKVQPSKRGGRHKVSLLEAF